MNQRKYTQEELDYLVTCPKEIVKPPRQTMAVDRGSYRNDMDLCSSEDSKEKFHVFMRKNERFEENFSIGLNYIPSEGGLQICLLRCNGPHGEHTNDLLSGKHHCGYHIHAATAENINAGFRSEKYALIVTEYINYDEALHYFLKRCNIIGSEKYFLKYITKKLFSELGDEHE